MNGQMSVIVWRDLFELQVTLNKQSKKNPGWYDSTDYDKRIDFQRQRIFVSARIVLVRVQIVRRRQDSMECRLRMNRTVSPDRQTDKPWSTHAKIALIPRQHQRIKPTDIWAHEYRISPSPLRAVAVYRVAAAAGWCPRVPWLVANSCQFRLWIGSLGLTAGFVPKNDFNKRQTVIGRSHASLTWLGSIQTLRQLDHYSGLWSKWDWDGWHMCYQQ